MCAKQGSIHGKLVERTPCTDSHCREMPLRRVQAAARLVSTDADARTFWLSPVQAGVLALEEGPDASPLFMAPMCGFLVAGAKNLGALQACCKTGVGLSYDATGAEVGCSVCRALAVWTRHNLLSHLKKIPGTRRTSSAIQAIAFALQRNTQMLRVCLLNFSASHRCQLLSQVST
jgi:hypothetical protein